MQIETGREVLGTDALIALGLACSSMDDGAAPDLVAAHAWFNLAALHGDAAAVDYRAEIAGEMTPRQINEAQRRARALMRDQQFLAASSGFC